MVVFSSERESRERDRGVKEEREEEGICLPKKVGLGLWFGPKCQGEL